MSNANENETLRLETFSDGVFAIATTLLAFQLEAPKHPEGDFRSGLLLHALTKQWPAYVAFFLSFATLYILWVNHHRLYNVIHRSDARFMFYNGLHLLLISLIPFTTSLLSNFIDTDAMALAGFVYMALFACICATLLVMWVHASADFYLLKRPAGDVKIKTVRLGLIISTCAYGFAALLALLLPYVSLVIGLGIVIYLARLKYHRERVV